MTGGPLADRLGRRDPRWYLWIPALSILVAIPLAIPFLLLEHARLAAAFYFPFSFFASMFLGPVLAAVYLLVKLRMRAMASAVLFFVLNLIGLGAGPQVVGVLNDVLDPRFGPEAVRYSLLVVDLLALLSVALFLVAAQSMRKETLIADSSSAKEASV